MAWVLLATTIFGVNLGVWLLVGLMRFSSGHVRGGLRVLRRGRGRSQSVPIVLPRHRLRRDLMAAGAADAADETVRLQDVCALVPAHNEEVGLADTLAALARILPLANIYVVSDASTDHSAEIVRDFGLHVVEVWPNRGKAGALAYAIEHFDLRSRYKALLIVDADTEIDEHYLERALPLINTPGVVAVAGHAHTKWRRHLVPRLSMFFPAYRVRLYRLLQFALRYGQTWRPTNVTAIIPGFASMYRTSILDQIEIDAKGLVIEDYNMTFEVQRKRLGRIAYSPAVSATAHDPDNLRDYVKQVTRWNLGLLQTVRRHGIWPSMFWAVLALYLTELVISSLLFLAAPVLLIVGLLIASPSLPLPLLDTDVTLVGFAATILLLDYALTAVVAAYDRKPLLLVYGLGFFLLRYLDALLFLRAIPMTLTAKSDGRWESPRRYRYDSAAPGFGATTRGIGDEAPPSIDPPDPLPSRAGRLAMVTFSGLSAALAVALVVLSISVLRTGAGDEGRSSVAQAAATMPGDVLANDDVAAGPVRAGLNPPPPAAQ